MPSDEEKHARLQAKLQDRKTSNKGRGSRPMKICLDAELSMDLEDADAELAAAEAAVEVAEANAEARAGGKVKIDLALTKRVTAAKKAVAEAEVAADQDSVIITFTALKADKYDELLELHPPREGNNLDKLSEYNRDTFPDALMAECALKQVKDVDGNLVDMDVAEIIAEMSNGERILACRVSNDLNLRDSSFTEANSRTRRRSGSNSNRR